MEFSPTGAGTGGWDPRLPAEPGPGLIDSAIRAERRTIRRRMRPVDLLGALILAVVVPSLLTTWISSGVAIGWGIGFAAVSVFAAVPSSRWVPRRERLHHRVSIAALTAAWSSIPLLVWADLDAAITAVTVLCLIVLAVHALNLSLSADDLWYVPSLAMGATVSIGAATIGAWSHAAMIGVFCLFVLAGGSNSDSVFRKQVRSAVLARFLRDRFEHEATHDALTGLPNRRAAQDWVDSRAGTVVTVAAIDFDDFKRINERWDHLVGDAALQVVADQLRSTLEGWTVTRVGGDEFVAFADGVQAVRSLGPFPVETQYKGSALSFDVGLSCGVTSGDPAVQDLHAEAEYALARSKMLKGRVTVMTAQMRDSFELQHRLPRDFDAALRDGRIEAWAQPVVTAADRRVIGVELFARWHHPEAGLLAPTEFLPAIGVAGRLHELADHMLEQAGALLAERPVDELGWVAVNIDPATFDRIDLPDRVFAVLARHEVDGARLCLEITESRPGERYDNSAGNARRLRRAGVKLALDDFASSSVSFRDISEQSTHFKLDRSIAADPKSEGLARALVAFAETCDALVVAEGIDTPAKADRMIAAGVPALQGYLIGAPKPLADWSTDDRLDARQVWSEIEASC